MLIIVPMLISALDRQERDRNRQQQLIMDRKASAERSLEELAPNSVKTAAEARVTHYIPEDIGVYLLRWGLHLILCCRTPQAVQ